MQFIMNHIPIWQYVVEKVYEALQRRALEKLFRGSLCGWDPGTLQAPCRADARGIPIPIVQKCFQQSGLKY